MDQIRQKFTERPLLWLHLLFGVPTAVFSLIIAVSDGMGDGVIPALMGVPFIWLMIYCIMMPLLLTLLNIYYLFRSTAAPGRERAGKWVELFTLSLGFLLNCLLLSLDNIRYADWHVQLSNSDRHTPVATGTMPTVAAILLVGFTGYLLLRLVPVKKLPPLFIVLCMSAMYLCAALCLLYMVQMAGNGNFGRLFHTLLPGNFLLIVMKTVKELVLAWEVRPAEIEDEAGEAAQGAGAGRRWPARCEALLSNARHWPWLAFLLMLPFLGVLVGVLALFGQRPDSVIRAFTDTAGWNLSQQTAPPNLIYDEHYLCTVAACGHAWLVKPLRMGERHGHPVVVNRQLCVANAFEQILQERTPRLHRAVRGFYDACGLPVARLVRTKKAADAVYLLMKPAEWLFLAVIYLCDVKPENRIALQYLPEKKYA